MAQAVRGRLFTEEATFDPRPVPVRLVVDKVALGQVSLPVLRFPPVSILPPPLHIHLHLHAAVIRRRNG
jgi:hypothetical protein